MPDMLKLAVLGVAAALCAVVVRKGAAELGVVLALAAGAVILSGVLGALEAVRGLLDTQDSKNYYAYNPSFDQKKS